ncbi:lipid II:glycine glycyltransferase FemX [Virgibacillus pantothenticus]|uniref:Lipid II:glycine glycyltransferase n=1 Tax=Virgibacillus pantothenticus TaxID=1473 RepID=A0A0L0QKI7_VIRPA|nr:GNAT family N-acetyltransferase [Virgibacillus pantothenticus]KNE18793.1 hypothetical protein AFK71_09340 [Virgibacillus pantothenticus]MED3736768.1 GNAT family N-acetyltransferase [Virgibacillus pantothenticus]QTY15218.1 GNAT family N-acetyltransferase [Virgibacillus pantothenticus]SIT05564.1 Acetyltransferase (GNAT) domain-containing protein [Virgibacillus pantothenticus]
MLSLIEASDREKWNKIVKGFRDYDIYYLNEYTNAFKIHGDGEPVLFYYEDSNIKAINVVMLRDIANNINFSDTLSENQYFDITTPYGYGGFLVEGKVTKDSIKQLNNEYIEKCNKRGIISEFVRFHPVLKNSDILEGLYDISELGKTITIKLDSQQQIWTDITSKNRNMIRKAKKSGVLIYWGRDVNLFHKFKVLYNATMDRDNAKDYYYFEKDFYDSILNDLKHNSMIFYALYENRIIAMSIILFSNQQMHYHLSASDITYRHLAPTNLLLYEAACWGCENGHKSFHLGGGIGSKEDNLYKFKKAFNKNHHNVFTIGKKIFNQELYNKLTEIRRENTSDIQDNMYFPKYRAEN